MLIHVYKCSGKEPHPKELMWYDNQMLSTES